MVSIQPRTNAENFAVRLELASPDSDSLLASPESACMPRSHLVVKDPAEYAESLLRSGSTAMIHDDVRCQ